MREFEELQQLWQKGPTATPVSFDALMQRIDAGKRALTVKAGLHILAFVFALVCLVLIWVNLTFVTWTSHAALLLVAGCLFYAMWAQYNSFRELYGGLSAESLGRPADYIARLKAFREKSFRRHTRTFRMYGACIAAALALFSLELYFVVSLPLFFGLVLFVVGWFLMSYFVFVKSYLENESKKIRELIGDLERINKQIS